MHRPDEPDDRYLATCRWHAERPQVLVVCCSDGRFHPSIVEFVYAEVTDRPDVLALPGGPVCIDPWNSSFDEARVFDGSMRLFEAAHDLRQAWLIAHQGCAYYGTKHPSLTGDAFEARQIADLRHSGRILRARSPELAVRLVFARLVGEHVAFERVSAEEEVAPPLPPHVIRTMV